MNSTGLIDSIAYKQNDIQSAMMSVADEYMKVTTEKGYTGEDLYSYNAQMRTFKFHCPRNSGVTTGLLAVAKCYKDWDDGVLVIARGEIQKKFMLGYYGDPGVVNFVTIEDIKNDVPCHREECNKSYSLIIADCLSDEELKVLQLKYEPRLFLSATTGIV